jgi:DNA-binding MarR family transcriptional regulator
MKSVWVRGWRQLQDIEKAMKLVAQETQLDGMPLLQIHVLEALYEQDGQHASTLAKAVEREATSFTPILDKLEKRGLICRAADPNDRRAVFIHLTNDGKALKADVARVMDSLKAAYVFKPFAVKQ